MEKVFINIGQHVSTIIRIIHVTAYILGFFLIFRALLKLKIYGEMRSMMAPHARLNQILLLLFVGVLLMFLESATTEVLIDAFFGNPMAAIPQLAYHNHQNVTADIQLAAKWITRLIGHIALFRGIIQLGSYQEGGRHTLAKSMTHMIAGVCAINIQQTLDLLHSVISVD